VLKRWPRYDENLNDEGKRFGRGIVGCQVGNEEEPVGLVNCQEGRGDIPIFQVGNGGEMSSDDNSYQRALKYEEEGKERPQSSENSRGIVGHVNEDNGKLKTSTVKDRDQRTILIIGGVEIFLPSR